QYFDDLARIAFEVGGLQSLGDPPRGRPVQSLGGGGQLAAFTSHDRHDIAAACAYKPDVHCVPLERLGFCTASTPSPAVVAMRDEIEKATDRHLGLAWRAPSARKGTR